MSEKRVVVPEGMLRAACRVGTTIASEAEPILRAALLHMTENPIVPTDEQRIAISTCPEPLSFNFICTEWQRRMFLAPEPEVPEEVKDLLLVDAVTFELPNGLKLSGAAAERNAAIIEAFNRGRKAGK